MNTSRVSESLESADWWDFSIPCHGVVVGRAEAYRTLSWGGGGDRCGGGRCRISLGTWVRLYLCYIINKVHSKTNSSIQITPMACLYSFMYTRSLTHWTWIHWVLTMSQFVSLMASGPLSWTLSVHWLAPCKRWVLRNGVWRCDPESCRGYGGGEKPWALEQRKDPKKMFPKLPWQLLSGCVCERAEVGKSFLSLPSWVPGLSVWP